jgi:WD40 repeat protein
MRIWNRLGDWVEEEFESAQMYKRLSDAAAMYQIGKTGLWRPPDLQLALNWQKKQKPTRAWAQRYDIAFERAVVFLDTSRITYEAELKNQEMMQRRVLRRTRATAIILGIAAIIAILFMVFAYMKMIEADQERLRANEQRLEAVRQATIAKQEQRRADSLRVLAQESSLQLEKTNVELERSLIVADQERAKALAALLEAKRQQRIALAASENERKAANLAEERRKEAQENFDKANRLLMLTKAQAMAAKSRQENDDKELAGLLAMQAYHFHRRYEGKKYDPYIYSGLYYSLTKLDNRTYNAIQVAGPARNSINSLSLSGQGTTFYTAGADGRLFMGDYLKLEITPLAFANAFPNKVIATTPNNQYLAVGTDSTFVQILDFRNQGQEATTMRGFRGGSNAIECLPDNSGFLVASGDYSPQDKKYEINFINPATREKRVITTLPEEGKCISLSPDGKRVAVGTWSGKVFVFNMADPTTLITLSREASARILSVQFSPDGKSLAYGIDDIRNKRGSVKIIDLTTSAIRVFSGHFAGVFDVEFSPDGKLMASAGADRRLQMWVLDHPEDLPIEMDNNNGYIFDVAFTANSDYLIATTSESEIRVWPTDASVLADKICPQLSRNMTQDRI